MYKREGNYKERYTERYGVEVVDDDLPQAAVVHGVEHEPRPARHGRVHAAHGRPHPAHAATDTALTRLETDGIKACNEQNC